MYGYFTNKSKYRLIVKNIYKNIAIYLKTPHNINYYIQKNITQCINKNKNNNSNNILLIPMDIIRGKKLKPLQFQAIHFTLNHFMDNVAKIKFIIRKNNNAYKKLKAIQWYMIRSKRPRRQLLLNALGFRAKI